MITKYFICLPMLFMLCTHGLARLIISQRQENIFTPQSFHGYANMNDQLKIVIPQMYEHGRIIDKFFEKNEVNQSHNQPYNSFINLPEDFVDKQPFPTYSNQWKQNFQTDRQSKDYPGYNSYAYQEKDENPKFQVLIFLSVLLPILGILIIFLIFCFCYCKRIKKQAGDKENTSGAKTAIKKSTSDLIQTQTYLNPLTKEICCICLNYNCNTTLPCSHYFHQECIQMWLQKIEYCPLCRTQMNKTRTFDRIQ